MSTKSSLKGIAASISIAVIVLAGCTPATGGGGSTDPRVCPTASAGQVRVAVVVDATGLGAGAATVTCVVVAQGSNGIVALTARAARLGSPGPTFNASGLLCSIDGAPLAPACGSVGPNGYEYWSYWLGGGSAWTYAPVGPASRSMQDGTVEGWRFLPGGAQLAPSTSSTFASLVS